MPARAEPNPTIGVEYRNVLFKAMEMRSDGAGGFSGVANLHNVVDSYGTHFTPGAWTAGGLDTDDYAFLWMHDPYEPVGVFRATEDERGLVIEGEYDDTDAGQRARSRAKRSAPGLSVGFVRLMVDPDDENAITEARLVEVSQITARFASQDQAAISDVRVKTEAHRIEQERRQRLAAALRLRDVAARATLRP